MNTTKPSEHHQATKPFDDDLSDLIGSTPRPRAPLPETFTPAAERAYAEACPKCGGTGRFRSFGQCFSCKGTGKLTFKTSAEDRAKGRTSYRKGKAEARREFAKEFKAEVAWVTENAERQHARAHKGQKVWNLPIELAEKLAQYGSWTDGQIGLIRKCMLRDQERASEAQTRQDAAPTVDASKVAAAFGKAIAAAAKDGEGIYGLVLRLDTFRFSLDRNGTGDIWIKEGDAWIAKILPTGTLKRFRACTDEQETRILAAAADPAMAAKAYGQRFKSCSCCGRTLTNPESRELGIGPICAAKWGLA